MTDSILRFSWSQRAQHQLMMVLFVALCLTGFPQKFLGAPASQAVVSALGGVGLTRLVHRVSGVLFTVLALWHVLAVVVAIGRRRWPLAMVVTRKDFTDAIVTLRYYLGLSREQARFDRYDYRQKFEYWGLAFGAVVMITTGFVLLFPVAVAHLLPGQVIPAAKLAHGSEGLMAFLVVILWHIYNALLNPDVFPLDASIFTGRISRERMEKEHPLELERLDASQPPEPPSAG